MLQDKNAPLVVLFDADHIGWEAAKWFVSIGALFGFSARSVFCYQCFVMHIDYK